MKARDKKYNKFALCREMLETPGIIQDFDWKQGAKALSSLKKTKSVFFTGEGSSRIFPAKNFMYYAQVAGEKIAFGTDGSRQAAEYDLKGKTVFGASNSGRTKEVVTLFRTLKRKRHGNAFSLSAFPDTPLEMAANEGYVLSCGEENAVAATKSVVEQGLFYQSLLDRFSGRGTLSRKTKKLVAASRKALTMKIDPKIVRAIAQAPVIHWAGRNTGVAEELTLKTNEITRKRSAYLEGTYAVHGIEEVMEKKDVVIVVEPWKAEEEKFEDVLKKGVGCKVIAIATRKTRFPTIRIPNVPGLNTYVRLQAGWNLLVEIGLACKIDLDKPERARKIGNAL